MRKREILEAAQAIVRANMLVLEIEKEATLAVLTVQKKIENAEVIRETEIPITMKIETNGKVVPMKRTLEEECGIIILMTDMIMEETKIFRGQEVLFGQIGMNHKED
jgi:hypothetical protein